MSVEDVLQDPAHEFLLQAEMQRIRWTHIVVHHSGAEEENTEQIRRHHRRIGFRDIGYHFCIERNGQLVPGRSIAWPGAHTSADNMNWRGTGVCLIGNFERRKPTLQQLERLNKLLVQLMLEWNIKAGDILGHNNVRGAATKCPGRMFDTQALTPLRLEVQGQLVEIPIRLSATGASEMLLRHPPLWVQIAPLIRDLGGSVWWASDRRTVNVQFAPSRKQPQVFLKEQGGEQ